MEFATSTIFFFLIIFHLRDFLLLHFFLLHDLEDTIVDVKDRMIRGVDFTILH